MNVYLLLMHFSFAVIYLLKVEQLSYHAQQIVSVAPCHLQIVATLGREGVVFGQVGKGREHQTQGGAYVVRGVYKEVYLLVIIFSLLTLFIIIPP